MRPRTKLLPIDYLVIVGGPIVVLLIIWFGIRAIVGPAPRPNPVEILRNGDIEIGADIEDAVKRLGNPSQVKPEEDGGALYIYTRTVYDQGTGSDSLDEATIEVTPGGRVQGIKFDRSAPPTPSGARG